jgi:ankyrin repeat protein
MSSTLSPSPPNPEPEPASPKKEKVAEEDHDLFDLLIKCVMKAECECCPPKSEVEKPWYGQDDTYRGTDDYLIAKFAEACPTAEEQQVVLKYRDNDKWSVWHHAARINSVPLIKFFCNQWNCPLSAVSDLESVVLVAVKQHSNAVVSTILYSFGESKGPTPFFESVKVKILEQALDCRNTEMALKMLQYFSVGALVNPFGGTESKSGTMSLAMRAVKQNNLLVVQDMSKPYPQTGVDFNNVTSANGDTAVQWAAYDGCIDVMLFLIEHLHLDVNAGMGRSGRRLLFEAYAGNKFTAYAMLLKLGATPDFFMVDPESKIRKHFVEHVWYRESLGKRQKWINPMLLHFPTLGQVPFDILAENRLLPHNTLNNIIAHLDVSRHWELQRAAPSTVWTTLETVYDSPNQQ